MKARPLLIYLDACVLLSYVNGAPDRASEVHSLLEDAESGKVQLLTSILSIAEVAYIASDQVLSDGTDDEATIDELWTPSSPIRLADVSVLVTRKARAISRQARANETKRVRSVDAVHLATAEINKCNHFFTYEADNTRAGWDSLITPSVSEPYVTAPRIPGVDS